MKNLIDFIEEVHRKTKESLRENFTEEEIEEMEKKTGFTKQINKQIQELNKSANADSNK